MGKGVSGHTHTQEQLNSYANQNNPNNDAYQSDLDNHANQLNPNNDLYEGSGDINKDDVDEEDGLDYKQEKDVYIINNENFKIKDYSYFNTQVYYVILQEEDALREESLKEARDAIRNEMAEHIGEKMTIEDMNSLISSLEYIDDDSFNVNLAVENKSWAYNILDVNGDIIEDEYFDIQFDILQDEDSVDDKYELKIKITDIDFV